jgi:hypothetical protein
MMWGWFLDHACRIAAVDDDFLSEALLNAAASEALLDHRRHGD